MTNYQAINMKFEKQKSYVVFVEANDESEKMMARSMKMPLFNVMACLFPDPPYQ